LKKILDKLVTDLFSVKIEFDRAIFFLDSLKYQDYDIYNRNIYSVECINNQHIFYHFNYHTLTHKNFIRKNCLLIDERNPDIMNSTIISSKVTIRV
jgi:hypothetical protein